MAKTLPYIGELNVGKNLLKVQRIVVGADSSDNPDVLVTDCGTYALWTPIPAGVLVKEIIAHVDTAWTGSVTLTVGDTDADGFLTSALIAPQTADSEDFASSFITLASTGNIIVASGPAYRPGRYYNAADTDGICLTVAGATPADGKTTFWIWYVEDILNG